MNEEELREIKQWAGDFIRDENRPRDLFADMAETFGILTPQKIVDDTV